KEVAKVAGDRPLAKALKNAIEGPFKKKLGQVAFLAEGRTAHYQLATDCGLDPEVVKATQAEWSKLAQDPKLHAPRLEKLKKRRSKGFDDVSSHLERIYSEYAAIFKFDRDGKPVG